MDDDLRGLKRLADADPSDPSAARRYDQALRRAEEDGLILERFRFKFACPLRFQDLQATDDPRTRLCGRCERPVQLTRGEDELAAAVAAGSCVAFPRAWADRPYARLAEEPELDSSQSDTSPCVLPSDVSWLDLSPGSAARAKIEPGLGGLFAGEVLFTGPALPLWIEGGQLHLAVSRLEVAESLLHHVQLASGTRTVQLHLADPALVFELLDVHAPPQSFLMGDVAFDEA